MAIWQKIYKLINWKNSPSVATPLGANNLGKMDKAIDELDNRVIELNTQRGNHKLLIDNLYAETDALGKEIEEVRTETNSSIDALKIISTASGNTAYMDDASNMGLEGIDFFGESKQDGTPAPTSPIPIESTVVNRIDVMRKNELNNTAVSITDAGLTYTVNDNKSVTVNGTATGLSIVKVGSFKNTDKDLILSGCPSGGSNSTYKLSYYHETTQANDFGNGVTLPKNDLTYEVRIVIYGGTTINNLTFYPMIRPTFFADATYEPYQSQTVNLSAPIELNGIGGVRDTDKLKKFGVVVFDGSDDEGWHARETSISGKSRNTTLILQKLAKPYATSVSANLLCTHYKAVPSNSAGTWGAKQGMCIDPTGTVMVYDENFNTEDVSLWKAHLQSNPITVVYELETPTETSLPQVDIDAIKNLHTYKPNTVVMNDGNAEMDVHYVADAKTYIDKKFEALASAIVNQ